MENSHEKYLIDRHKPLPGVLNWSFLSSLFCSEDLQPCNCSKEKRCTKQIKEVPLFNIYSYAFTILHLLTTKYFGELAKNSEEGQLSLLSSEIPYRWQPTILAGSPVLA